MGKLYKWIGVAAVGMTLTGCVSSNDYKAMKAQRDQALQQRNEAQAEAESYKDQLGQVVTSEQGKDAEIADLSSQNSTLQSQLDDLNKKYSDTLSTVSTTGAQLPPALVNDLTVFASEHKDMCEFDAKHGVVRFKSDITFAKGSSDLTPKAKDTVAKLAKILSGKDAGSFELFVAGHTDSTRVAHAETIKKGNIDNWYLSAHRAIAVGSELRAMNVSPKRLAMVGYADQRPIAGNDTEAGRALNRRVEILILPAAVGIKDVAVNPTTMPTASATRKHHTASKEASATTDNRPVFNK